MQGLYWTRHMSPTGSLPWTASILPWQGVRSCVAGWLWPEAFFARQCDAEGRERDAGMPLRSLPLFAWVGAVI